MKGHKLIRSRSGAQDGYARGRCECGVWSYDGWTHWMRDVVFAHRQHCERVVRGKPEYHRHSTQPYVQQVPCGPFSPIPQQKGQS